MPFPVACQCGQRFMAEDYLTGQQVPCPACGYALLIQNPAAARPVVQTPRTVQLACHCGRVYQPGPELAGRTVRCTACGNVLQIPALPGAPQPLPTTVPALPQRTVFPSTMKHPARTKRPTAARNPEASEQLVLRIVIGIAIAVCFLAVVGGIGYAVLPMTRQLADRGQVGDESASSSDTTTSPDDGEAFIDTHPVETADSPAAAAPGDAQRRDSSAADNMVGAPTAQASHPFETRGENVGDATTGGLGSREYASATIEGTPASDFNSGRAEVARSGVANSGVGQPLDLVGSINAWRDRPNRQLAGIRKISGDNLAVYAHYSWMTELLPHLGHQEVYDKFDFSESWLEEKNLQLSGELIPQFQNPGDKRERWKGYPFNNMALTHFVGMAGVEDRRNVVAAKLPRRDARAGIFGYDEVASRDEISDGESQTILLIGSGKLASPWVAGGGATVRGAREPYFDELTGFGSPGGQSGAITVMADGSVRHISASIDPAAFRALSTIHGGESVDVSRWISAAKLSK